MSLSDLKKNDDNTYYAGGEKSGMAIEGGGGNPSNREHQMIRDILQQAERY